MRTSLWLACVGVVLALLARIVFQRRFDPKEMAGKHVLVTGGSMGIGEHIAYELAQMKAHVIIVARSKDKMERIVKKCVELGAPSANYISVDLSTRDEKVLHKIVDDATKIFGGVLDMFIINHLTQDNIVKNWPEHFAKQGLDWFVDQYYVNVFSYFALSNYALPILERNRGKLVIVSSAAGVQPIFQAVGYSSMKFAINGYFNALRANLEVNNRFNTTITTCILGAIGTEVMLEKTAKVANAIKPAAPDECARDIIAAGQVGERTTFFPYMEVRSIPIAVAIAPQFMEKVLVYVMGAD